jgi:hypothetical protein
LTAQAPGSLARPIPNGGGRLGRLRIPATPVVATAVVIVGAGAAVIAVGLQLISSSPLRVDEAAHSYGLPTSASLSTVLKSALAGHGSPLFALLQWLTVRSPGGVLGFRVVSLIAILVALPAFMLLASRIFSRVLSSVALLVFAVTPAVIAASTAGAGYATALAVTMWGFWGVLRLLERPSSWRVVAAGVVLGAVSFVYPLGLVYALLIVVAALALRPKAAPAPGRLDLVELGVPWLAFTALGPLLGWLLGPYSSPVVFSNGISAVKVTIMAMLGYRYAYILVGLAVLGLCADLRARPWRAAFLAVWAVVPMLLVSFVQYGAATATPYLLVSLPAFVLLVVRGMFALGSPLRSPIPAVVVLAAVLVGIYAVSANSETKGLEATHLPALARAVSAARPSVLLFSDGDLAAPGDAGWPYGFTAGKPPALIDAYVSLANGVPVGRLPGSGSVSRVIGAWIFESPPASGHVAAFALFATPAINGTVTRTVDDTYALVMNSRPLRQAGLLGLNKKLQEAWIATG